MNEDDYLVEIATSDDDDDEKDCYQHDTRTTAATAGNSSLALSQQSRRSRVASFDGASLADSDGCCGRTSPFVEVHHHVGVRGLLGLPKQPNVRPVCPTPTTPLDVSTSSEADDPPTPTSESVAAPNADTNGGDADGTSEAVTTAAYRELDRIGAYLGYNGYDPHVPRVAYEAVLHRVHSLETSLGTANRELRTYATRVEELEATVTKLTYAVKERDQQLLRIEDREREVAALRALVAAQQHEKEQLTATIQQQQVQVQQLQSSLTQPPMQDGGRERPQGGGSKRSQRLPGGGARKGFVCDTTTTTSSHNDMMASGSNGVSSDGSTQSAFLFDSSAMPPDNNNGGGGRHVLDVGDRVFGESGVHSTTTTVTSGTGTGSGVTLPRINMGGSGQGRSQTAIGFYV
eukprot:PhM_4_TR16902/c0_g1_i1/m.26058